MEVGLPTSLSLYHLWRRRGLVQTLEGGSLGPDSSLRPAWAGATVCLRRVAGMQQILSSSFLSVCAAFSLVLWQREQALVWSFNFVLCLLVFPGCQFLQHPA